MYDITNDKQFGRQTGSLLPFVALSMTSEYNHDLDLKTPQQSQIWQELLLNLNLQRY